LQGKTVADAAAARQVLKTEIPARPLPEPPRPGPNAPGRYAHCEMPFKVLWVLANQMLTIRAALWTRLRIQ